MKIMNLQQPVAYILVGLPGSGKSTWVKSKLTSTNEYIIISSDAEIETYARSKGVRYSDVFDEYVKTATSMMRTKLDDAIKNNKNIIWDQTNMSKKKRRSILQGLPPNYKKIAVIFDIDNVELSQRLKKREDEEGKHIPSHIIDNMRRSYEPPTESEGFDSVIRI